ncbi:MAG TPA: glycerophosphodiester phosphodiesterase [Armatimonadota bacterium]|jgi:glycerophosphoryl diester phosphodiesterase
MQRIIIASAMIYAGAAFAAPQRATTKMYKPYICAHRGASSAAPENTLAAFKLAVELGAEAVELDTSLTSDGVPVVCHDGTVDRTTNGKGAIESMTYARIRKLDAGSWKDARFKGEHMPALEDVFRMKNRPYINIEIKAVVKDVNKLADTVVAMIERYGLEKSVIVSSFNGPALERVHLKNPAIATGFLYSGKTPDTLPNGITALHPMYPTVTRDFMAFAKGKGLEVNVWTVDDPAEMRRLIALGVDSIITNVPAVMKDVLSGQARPAADALP